jgi:peptidoglycan/LPS O-acetylase OafA/YrhL
MGPGGNLGAFCFAKLYFAMGLRDFKVCLRKRFEMVVNALLEVGRRLIWPRDAGAFRLWLALVVVLHHITRIEIGKAPVLVFFALSGFWVHRVWHQRYSTTHQPWLTFWVSRWWRIAPVFVLASVLGLAAHYATGNKEWPLIVASAPYQAMAGFTLVGYAQLVTRPVGPAWSLDIEMQFYLVAPLLIMTVRRASALTVIVLGCALFIAAMTLGAGVTLPSFLIFFLCGLVAAAHDWRVDQRTADGLFALAIGLVGLALALKAGDCISENGAYAPLFNLLVGLLALPFALTTVSRRSDPFDRMLGDQSYLAYLLHWPAIIVIRNAGLSGEAFAWLELGAGMATILLCLAAWRWYDRPLDRARANWVLRRADPALRKRDDKGAFFA